MLPDRIRKQIQLGRERAQRLLCKKCGVVMRDYEEMSPSGEFVHPRNGCLNGGITFDREPPRKRKQLAPVKTYSGYQYQHRAISGIATIVPKKHQRARARGARLASKYRPK